MPGESHTTTARNIIRHWIEARGATRQPYVARSAVANMPTSCAWTFPTAARIKS